MADLPKRVVAKIGTNSDGNAVAGSNIEAPVRKVASPNDAKTAYVRKPAK